MDKCVNETVESKRFECLHDEGTIYNPNKPICVPREEVLSQLNDSLKDFPTGSISATEQRLTSFLSKITNCSR